MQTHLPTKGEKYETDISYHTGRDSGFEQFCICGSSFACERQGTKNPEI